MKKLTMVTAVAVLAVFAFMFIAVLAACGGGGNLKGTIWVGEVGVTTEDEYFRFLKETYPRPVLTFRKIEFADKAKEVTVWKNHDTKMFQKEREYEVKGKKLLIYIDAPKDATLNFLKNFPDKIKYGDLVKEAELGKDTITLDGMVYHKKTKEEAKQMLEEIGKVYDPMVEKYWAKQEEEENLHWE